MAEKKKDGLKTPGPKSGGHSKRHPTSPMGGSGLLPAETVAATPDEATRAIAAVDDDATRTMAAVDDDSTRTMAAVDDDATRTIAAVAPGLSPISEDSPAPAGLANEAASKRRSTHQLGGSGLIPVTSPPDTDATPESPRRTTSPIGNPISGRVPRPTVNAPSTADDTLESMANAASDQRPGGDPLGSGPLDSGRSEPSKPNAVIGPITKRHRQTAPYIVPSGSGEILLENLKKKDAPQNDKKPKSLARRILKGVGWTVLGLFVLILLAVAFFHTGPGKEVARGVVEGALAKRFDGEVTLGEIDYALFGDVELKDLKIKEKGGGRTVVHLSNLLVELDWGSLLSAPLTIDKLAIDGLALDMVAFPDGTNSLNRMQKEPSKLPDAIVIKDLALSRVSLAIERGEGDARTLIGLADFGMKASLAMDKAKNQVTVDVTQMGGRVSLTRGSDLAVSLPIAATLSARVDGDSVAVRLVPEPTALKLTRAGQDLAVPVSIGALEANLKDRIATLGLGQVSAGPLSLERITARAELAPPAPEGSATPAYPIKGDLLFELVGMKLDQAGVNTLLGRELLATDVTIDASVKGPQSALLVVGDVATAGGNLGLTGKIDATDLLAPVYSFQLLGVDLDTSKLLLRPDAPSLRTSFKATLNGEGLPQKGGRVRFDLAVDKTIVTQTTPTGVVLRTIDGMTVAANSEGPVIALEGLVVKAFGQTLTVDGQIDRESREVRAGMRMKSRLAEAIAKAREAGVLIAPLPPIEGELDVDFGLSGRLKPFEELARLGALPADAPMAIERLPFEVLNIKGTARADDLVVLDRKVGSLQSDVNVDVDERGPASLKGRIATRIGNIDAGALHLDGVDLEVLLDGFVQHIKVAVRDERQALAVDVAIKSVLDLDKRHVDATFEKVEIKRGAFETKLQSPVTIGIDQPDGGPQRLVVPPMTLSLAGGTIALSSAVDLSPDPANPGANKLDRFDATVDLDNVDIQRLAALARRSTQGLSGRMSGTLRAQGSPDNPQVEMVGALRGRLKGGEPTTSKLDVTLRNKVLDARVTVLDKKSKPVLELDVLAPITLPQGPGQKAGLAPGGRLSIEAKLFPTTLDRLLALAPNPALKDLDPDAKVSGQLALSGTTARPNGSWNLSLEGDFLRRRGFEKAPARQKLDVTGSLKRGDIPSITVLDNRLGVWLDADSAPLVAHSTRGDFSRSPLLRDFLGGPWTLEAGLDKPLDFRAIADAGLTNLAISGGLTTSAKLSGKGQDVLGDLDFALAEVRVGTAPRVDFDAKTTIADDHIAMHHVLRVAGLEAMVTDAKVGVPGRGLRQVAKQRQRLMASPISGQVRLVEHLIADWKKALGEVGQRLPNLPGQLGGALALGGTLAVPTADGAFAWDGFETVSGAPGRIAFAVAATPDQLGGGLEIGANREVQARASLSRKALSAQTPTTPLPVDLKMTAAAVDILTLVPAFALAPPPSTTGRPQKPLDLQGKLDWDMAGRINLERDPALAKTRPLAPGSNLAGHFTISGLDIAVPDTDRHMLDGIVKMVATADGLNIERIHFREADIQRPDRTVTMTGAIAWKDLVPSTVRLDIKTHEWLVMGLGFDDPEAELDSAINIEVSALDQPIKKVVVTIESLDLNSPDRFVRAHQAKFPAYDDLIYVTKDQASGKLPFKRPATPSAADPNSGFDISLRIPESIHVIVGAPSPIELELHGNMDVTMRGSDINLKGRLDMTEGVLGAMGRDFTLLRGAVTADGGIDSALAEMVFAHRPNDIALRDVAAGDHNNLATITVRASAKNGLQTIFGGVSGPYLLDMATFLNTGRGRLWGPPDSPSSETVRFGHLEQGLVNSFVQTNLRNLMFMDRANGWAPMQEDYAQYGRLRHFDMQRFLPAEDRTRSPGQRIRFAAQPLDIGRGPFELAYDWLLVSDPRAVFGFGPFVDFDLRAGVGFSFEWSSTD